MKEKILSILSFITIFVPFTAAFIWSADSPSAVAIIIGYCIFAAISLLYTLFLFVKMHFRNIYTKIALAINSIYVAGILFTVVIPHLI